MQIVDLNRQPKEEWRPGVMTQMYVSALNGATQLCVFEQWCEPGHGAPTHLHAVEEILRVFEVQADVWIGEAHVTPHGGPARRRAGRPQARFFQQRHHDLAHPVHARRAGVRGRLRRQARNAAALAAGVGLSAKVIRLMQMPQLVGVSRLSS